MKKMMLEELFQNLIHKETYREERFFVFALLLFSFLLPFAFKILSLFLAVCFGIALFHLILRKKRVRFSRLLLVFILFYGVHFVSVFYSDNSDEAWFDIEVKMSFFLFPLIAAL